MKPIIFNTDMTSAVRDDRKTATRRLPRRKYCDSVFEFFRGQLCEAAPDKPPIKNGDGTTTHFLRPYVPCKPPYLLGDILYVPEPWKCYAIWDDMGYVVEFPDGEYVGFEFTDPERARRWKKYLDKPAHQWQSPYFMPREAARLFLRVTDVRAERLRDITEEQATREGIYQLLDEGQKDYKCWTYKAHPRGNGTSGKVWSKDGGARSCFLGLWNSTIKMGEQALYGWEANPWVWVIEFERISKEEAEK